VAARHNENTNGLLRQYFPKGTDLSRWSANELDAVANALNTRPRKTLNGSRRQKRLMNIYDPSNKPALQRPVEPKLYPYVHYSEQREHREADDPPSMSRRVTGIAYFGHSREPGGHNRVFRLSGKKRPLDRITPEIR